MPDPASGQQGFPAQEPGTEETRRVVMLGFHDAQVLDITGPLEVFSRTTRWLRDHLGRATNAYTVELVSEVGGPVRMSSGLEMLASRSCFDVTDADILLVAGGPGHAQAMRNPALLRWLQECASRSGRIGSICNGALVLAAAGLLRDRKATTHWAFCKALADTAGAAEILPDAIFVQDGSLYTSAGVTAGMDLALAMVEEDFGRTVATRVAQELVMYLVRPGGQSQFSHYLEAQKRDGQFGELQLWMLEHIAEQQPLDRLAGIAGMSERHFRRRFKDHFGLTPSAYLARLRLGQAKMALEEGRGLRLKELARRYGFGTEQNLRRAFKRQVGITPEDYRDRFVRPSKAEQSAPS